MFSRSEWRLLLRSVSSLFFESFQPSIHSSRRWLLAQSDGLSVLDHSDKLFVKKLCASKRCCRHCCESCSRSIHSSGTNEPAPQVVPHTGSCFLGFLQPVPRKSTCIEWRFSRNSRADFMAWPIPFLRRPPSFYNIDLYHLRVRHQTFANVVIQHWLHPLVLYDWVPEYAVLDRDIDLNPLHVSREMDMQMRRRTYVLVAWRILVANRIKIRKITRYRNHCSHNCLFYFYFDATEVALVFDCVYVPF